MFNAFSKNENHDNIYNRIGHLYNRINENSISNQALKDVDALKYYPKRDLTSELENKTDEILILTKLYHEHPNISANFVNDINKFLEVITHSYDEEFDIEDLIEFMESKAQTLYFDFTYAISQKLITFPQNQKVISALSSYWIENTENLALLNFSLIYEALIVNTFENQRNTQIAIKLLRYPQTILSACYYLINCFVNNKELFNKLILNELKSNQNIHVRTFLLHFLLININSIENEEKIYLLIHSKKLFNILCQYRINELFLSIKPDDFDPSKFSDDEIISVFETFHLLAIEGPKSGLTLNENTVEIVDKLFTEIINREKEKEIFFPIFFYKPFLSLLNFYKDHVGKNLDTEHQKLIQNLLNKIFDKFKLREEKLEDIDKYTPETFIHKLKKTPDNIELHLFEDFDGKILTIYPLIKAEKPPV